MMENIEEPSSWKDMLDNTREAFYSKRKSFNIFDKLNNKLKVPGWLAGFMFNVDRLGRIYHFQKSLYSKGRLVYGHIVQANTLLFSKGNENHPANIIFSDDEYFDTHLDKLAMIASTVYRLKEEKGLRSDLQALGDLLEDENEREFYVRLPVELTGNKIVYLTTIMVHREKLPLPYLFRGWFPVLILPEDNLYTIILPAKYWSDEMVTEWMGTKA